MYTLLQRQAQRSLTQAQGSPYTRDPQPRLYCIAQPLTVGRYDQTSQIQPDHRVCKAHTTMAIVLSVVMKHAMQMILEAATALQMHCALSKEAPNWCERVVGGQRLVWLTHACAPFISDSATQHTLITSNQDSACAPCCLANSTADRAYNTSSCCRGMHDSCSAQHGTEQHAKHDLRQTPTWHRCVRVNSPVVAANNSSLYSRPQTSMHSLRVMTMGS